MSRLNKMTARPEDAYANGRSSAAWPLRITVSASPFFVREIYVHYEGLVWARKWRIY
jgi:hypothetical protein